MENPTAGTDTPICSLPLTNVPSCELNDLNPPITSPCSDGTTDPPPAAAACQKMPSGGGNGAGSSKSAGPTSPITRPAACQAQAQLSKLLSSLGTTLASLASRPPSAQTNIPIASTNPSTSGMILVIIVIGGILLFMSFAKGE